MQQCLTALMTMIKFGHGKLLLRYRFFLLLTICKDIVVSNAILVLKSLVQTQLTQSQYTLSSKVPTSSEALFAIISHLARRVDDITHSHARACVLWLVGQYSETRTQTKGTSNVPEGVVDWAPDVLRKMAKVYSQEV